MDKLDLVRVRQLEIAVRIWHPEASSTLIAWHGLARHGGDFEGLARQLGPEWRILAPDTPGRGLSSWSLFPAHDYLYSHYMQIAIALLDHYELDHVPWLGTSMGGLLGMLIAADDTHGDRIEQLILNDVGPEIDPQGLAGLASYFAIPHRFYTFGELLTELRDHYASFGITDDATWQAMALESARRLPDGSWTFHYDPRIAEQFVNDTPRDTWADWAAIRCPLTVIRGVDSTILAADTVHQMKLQQPGLATLDVPGCGHAPMLNTPSQVQPISDFLNRPADTISPATTKTKVQGSLWQRLLHWVRSLWPR
ncbi:alpha/beta fold hydrolase [Aidingimonas halophila]|uniref:Pimeloyl-ACP methyl ester carboxylesterase n=1 Tax=Aidingimonas halophila TaxID=574349 RepID=A0A1H3EG17_9GAMM|nr:alpha/beta hydrolase [Aidingimonas halophila]GHC33442.1 hydrolase [Aidingimonas halophila]SDX77570.1 Pimeloyl-ACP methyl ester carboxylesterase [Aidingimonas halophila]